MATTFNFKDLIDLPSWRRIANFPINSHAGASSICGDMRNNEDRSPFLYRLNINGQFDAYNFKNDGWIPGYGGNFGLTAGNSSACFFMPSHGPNGTLAAGASTTKVILSTALPTAVATNALANRGDGRGYKLRIIGNSAGGSGKIEERLIVGNTSGTTPTIYLDSALSFTPASGDAYEFLSGKIYALSQLQVWKAFDIATGTISSLTTTGLTNLSSASRVNLIGLDELLTPVDQAPGSGFFGTLVATATAAGTLTGQAASGDAGVLSNEYRNFQIRIVQDTGTPTAVGQRRKISSHTAGASPVYTLASNWTVTPSATASYVIEFDTDKIIAVSDNSTAVNNYNIAANTWDTTTWAAKSNTASFTSWAAGSWGLSVTNLGAGHEARNSYWIGMRANTANQMDQFDIAGASTGAWTALTTVVPTVNSNIAGYGIYDPCTNSGMYAYVNSGHSHPTGAIGQMYYRLDIRNRIWESWTFRPFPENGTPPDNSATMAHALFIDGSTKLSFLTALRTSASATSTGANCEAFQIACQR